MYPGFIDGIGNANNAIREDAVRLFDASVELRRTDRAFHGTRPCKYRVTIGMGAHAQVRTK